MFQKDKERRERREAKKALAASAVADEDDDEVLKLRSQAAHSRRPLRRFFFPSDREAGTAATKKSDASQPQVV